MDLSQKTCGGNNILCSQRQKKKLVLGEKSDLQRVREKKVDGAI